MKIIFTKHANDKFSILERHGFTITKSQVIRTLENPETIDPKSRYPLKIAGKRISNKYILRVVFKKEYDIIKVITFYPKKIK